MTRPCRTLTPTGVLFVAVLAMLVLAAVDVAGLLVGADLRDVLVSDVGAVAVCVLASAT